MKLLSKATMAGFAIFAMLFGSGNIVFPIMLGKQFATKFEFAMIGWLISAAFIPILGFYGAMLYDADNKKYLSPLGKHLSFALILLVMIVAGPFGTIPRNINVSFGGIVLLAPNASMIIFNLFFCMIGVALAWNPGKLVTIMSKVFTPLKFGGVLIIAVAALWAGGKFGSTTGTDISVFTTTYKSFEYGYQTLDLLSSFQCAIIIFMFLKNCLPEKEQNNKKLIVKFAGMSCAISVVIFSIVYIILILIGAQYSDRLQGIPNESLFTQIASIALGGYASWFIAIVISACCLGSNVALTSVFTDYVHKDLLKEKYKRTYILLAVGVLIFAMSLLGFEQIIHFLGIILSAIYPAIIVFTFIKVIYYFVKLNKKQ